MTPPLPAAELDAIEVLLKKATPGPWMIESVYQQGCVDAKPCTFVSEGVTTNDTELICALRNAAPSLLASARREARMEALLSSTNIWLVGEAPRELTDAIAKELDQ